MMWCVRVEDARGGTAGEAGAAENDLWCGGDSSVPSRGQESAGFYGGKIEKTN